MANCTKQVVSLLSIPPVGSLAKWPCLVREELLPDSPEGGDRALQFNCHQDMTSLGVCVSVHWCTVLVVMMGLLHALSHTESRCNGTDVMWRPTVTSTIWQAQVDCTSTSTSSCCCCTNSSPITDHCYSSRLDCSAAPVLPVFFVVRHNNNSSSSTSTDIQWKSAATTTSFATTSTTSTNCHVNFGVCVGLQKRE